MAEYISREDVLDIVSQYCADDDGSCSKADVDLREMLDEIEALPTADVQPVKRGEWDGYVCSECNECADYFISGDFYFDEKPNFCPNCGARMDGDANG